MDINSLKDIFKCQRDLVELVQRKEWRLGYAPPHPREMDFLVRKHQDWFRTLAWYFVEEVAEYELSSDQHRPDELSDCLHFMVELCLFAGLDKRQVRIDLDLDAVDDDLAKVRHCFFPISRSGHPSGRTASFLCPAPTAR